MRKIILLGLATVGLFLTACQPESYKIKGTIEGLNNGDTLFITSDLSNYIPDDTIIVNNGTFESNEKSDSIKFCLIYCNRNNNIAFPFFIEPGNIKMHLNFVTNKSNVKGTQLNDSLQSLNNYVYLLKNQIDNIKKEMRNKLINENKRKNSKKNIALINQKIRTAIIHAANDNIKNEYGYYLVTTTGTDILSDNIREDLINRMPDNIRKRPEMMQIIANIRRNENSAIGEKLSGFQMENPDGKLISIYNEIRNHKITIIDFWASWCSPCRNEMPELVKLYSHFHKSGLGIVGISLDSKSGDWENAIKELNITWTQLSDLKGWNNMAAQVFGITSIPYIIIVDNKGIILQKEIRGKELHNFIQEKLN